MRSTINPTGHAAILARLVEILITCGEVERGLLLVNQINSAHYRLSAWQQIAPVIVHKADSHEHQSPLSLYLALGIAQGRGFVNVLNCLEAFAPMAGSS